MGKMPPLTANVSLVTAQFGDGLFGQAAGCAAPVRAGRPQHPRVARRLSRPLRRRQILGARRSTARSPAEVVHRSRRGIKNGSGLSLLSTKFCIDFLPDYVGLIQARREGVDPSAFAWTFEQVGRAKFTRVFVLGLGFGTIWVTLAGMLQFGNRCCWRRSTAR